MENLEINSLKEYLSESVDKNVNLDELAENYAEKVRQSIVGLKNKEDDPHLEYINPNELNHDDLIIFDKLQKGILSERDLNDYRKRADSYFELQVKNKGKDFDLYKDSHSNLLAMVTNKLISQIFEKKLIERKNERENSDAEVA